MSKIKQSKADAITQLMYEASKGNYATQTSVDRCIRACKTLGLTQNETIEILDWLDICDKTGKAYKSDIKIKLW